ELPKEVWGIAADHVRLWLPPQRRKQKSAAQPTRPAASPSNANLPIDHMLAWQNVAMVSPQLDADTERLEIWFEAAPPAGAAEGVNTSSTLRDRRQLPVVSKHLPASSAKSLEFRRPPSLILAGDPQPPTVL